MMKFYLNDQLVELEQAAPTLSVLEYLRTSMALVGTKEGCAAGDCGACTVVLGELTDTTVRYRAINACITPLGSLHGKQLITVEHLRQGGRLHPVQQAMVDLHGSQCGFCTPGIVMSLFAWWKETTARRQEVSRHAVEIALSGNLCRCTGYQPIFRAAQRIAEHHDPDGFSGAEPGMAAKLTSLAATSGDLHWHDLHFLAPRSASEASAMLAAHPRARLVAGATDLGLDYTQALRQPATLIFLGHARDCRQIVESEHDLTLGAALSYTDLEAPLTRCFPAFGALLNRLGSLQIRNQGTLGGNIANASPIGDTPPVLLALNATLELEGQAGSRTVGIDGFFSGYRQTVLEKGELIRAVRIPKLQQGELLKVYKIAKRFDDDISAVCMALWLRLADGVIEQVRLGFGGMAATPMRASHTEQFLRGKPFSEATAAAAGDKLEEDFTPIDDVRASSAYRLAVAEKLLMRAWLEECADVDVDLFSEHRAGTIAGGYYHA